MQTTRNQQERSFPLISLIQLFTFFVALLVCIDAPKLNERLGNIQNNVIDYLVAILLAGLFGLLVGASVGLGQIRNWRSMCFCGVAGSILGIFVLAIYVAPARPSQAIAAAMLPLLTTFVLRVRAS